MSQSDAIETLTSALLTAKGVINHQGNLLAQLTSSAYKFATVVAVNAAEDLSHADFTAGATIKFLSGDYAGEDATIIKPRDGDGDVRIRFDLSQEETYYRLSRLKGEFTSGSVMLNGKSIGSVLIVADGSLYQVAMPPFPLKAGNTVKILPDSLQIVETSPLSTFSGNIATVLKPLTSLTVEVLIENESRVVYNTGFELKAGDRVLLDAENAVILQNLGPDKGVYLLEKDIAVDWNNIGGLDEQISLLRQATVYSALYPEKFAHYGVKPPKGALLYGPPGNGKTLLAKALATEISAHHNKQGAKGGFMHIRGPELLDKFIGVSEARLRTLFQQGADFFNKHGFPAVLFIDECDGLFKARGSGISSDMTDTLVPQMLSLMDGLENNVGLVVLLATNRPDQLDPALLREGRISHKIYIPRPNAEASRRILNVHLGKIPLICNSPVTAIVDDLVDRIFSDAFPILNVHFSDGTSTPIGLQDVLSGALLEGIATNALTNAIGRDISQASKAPSGVWIEDITTALNRIYSESAPLVTMDTITDVIPMEKRHLIKNVVYL